MLQTIIDVKNISKTFGAHLAVNDLSLQVQQGEIYGFLGPNGSGKSTTLRMIMTLLKPDNGSISINGFDVHNDRQKAMQEVGCIIEKPDFYSYLSAVENLKIFARMHGTSTDKSVLYKLLDDVGLKGREKDILKTFSHGMKQRLGLAQALLHNPNIIILDEPNTGLDPNGIIELRETILRLNKQEGKTILLSSHILNEIEAIAESMILINKGKTVAQGKVQDLLSKEDLVVSIEVNNVAKTMQLIENSIWNNNYQESLETQLVFKISHDAIPALVQHITANNIDIYGIEKSRSLERYFLKLTQE
jgi:ABC-type multidrug transport system ATPase subunit